MSSENEVLGSLTEAEVAQMRDLQIKAGNIMHQIGQLEVTKLDYLFQVGEIKEAGEQVIRQATQRLGIPEGVRYQIGSDGRVIRVG